MNSNMKKCLAMYQYSSIMRDNNRYRIYKAYSRLPKALCINTYYGNSLNMFFIFIVLTLQNVAIYQHISNGAHLSGNQRHVVVTCIPVLRARAASLFLLQV